MIERRSSNRNFKSDCFTDCVRGTYASKLFISFPVPVLVSACSSHANLCSSVLASQEGHRLVTRSDYSCFHSAVVCCFLIIRLKMYFFFPGHKNNTKTQHSFCTLQEQSEC